MINALIIDNRLLDNVFQDGTIVCRSRILEDLHTLLSHNVIGPFQYEPRYVGFYGELAALQHFRELGVEFLSGGLMIPLNPSDQIPSSESIYVNIGDEAEIEQYHALFSIIARLGFEHMYFISHDAEFENWEREDIMGFGTEIAVPNCQLYIFDQEKNQLEATSESPTTIGDLFANVEGERGTNRYPIFEGYKQHHLTRMREFCAQDLLDLYVSRYVLDGLIGFAKNHGIMTDIDCVIIRDETYVLCEIKEKDLSKKPPQGFGMDTRRMEQLISISDLTELPYLYIVRRVEEQTRRWFLEWRMIDMIDFQTHTTGLREIEGGHGMRMRGSSNPTLVCPIEYFDELYF